MWFGEIRFSVFVRVYTVAGFTYLAYLPDKTNDHCRNSRKSLVVTRLTIITNEKKKKNWCTHFNLIHTVTQN